MARNFITDTFTAPRLSICNKNVDHFHFGQMGPSNSEEDN